ncbi:MAG: NUDIX domain-containing protein [Patescibacteria group bacterium]
MNTFSDQINSYVDLETVEQKTREDFLELLESGSYIREEGAKKHFSVYFFPYNPETKQVFIVHHKKAGLWLSPGGHIDSGENPLNTLKREIREELGVKINPGENTKPFFLSTVKIGNKPEQSGCDKHYDIWFLIETDGNDFAVDPREFLETKWVTLDEARELITDPSTLEALDIIESKER